MMSGMNYHMIKHCARDIIDTGLFAFQSLSLLKNDHFLSNAAVAFFIYHDVLCSSFIYFFFPYNLFHFS